MGVVRPGEPLAPVLVWPAAVVHAVDQPFPGREPAALATESFPVTLPCPSTCCLDGMAGVGLEAAKMESLTRRFRRGAPLRGLALGEPAVVAGAADAVAVADLGDRGRVDDVVEPRALGPSASAR
jgi:hypothetical protein